MEKIELKHLSPYLPYGLKIKVGTKILELSTSHTTSKIHIEMVCKKSIYKPILRPLSDLTKEIEVNGIKFTPQRTWGISQGQLKTTLFYKDCGEMYFRHIKLLFEFHFDVFGLIEKGLAIDINTIKQ